MAMKPTYLGDSVYAEMENGMVKLYTNNGFGPREIIYLEPSVMDELNAWYMKVYAKSKPPEPKECEHSGAKLDP